MFVHYFVIVVMSRGNQN